jgi:hypothetical protein
MAGTVYAKKGAVKANNVREEYRTGPKYCRTGIAGGGKDITAQGGRFFII